MKLHLSNRVTEWTSLPNALLHGKVLELQKNGENIIDLIIGISDLTIPDEGKHAAISAIKKNKSFYTSVSGDSDLKQSIQQKLKKQNRLIYDVDNIIVTTGAKQAIFQALYVLTNLGDQVAIIKPYWPAHTQVLKMLNLTPYIIDLNDIINENLITINEGIKVLLFDLPHNPTGYVFSKKELTSILSFARKYNIFIIADESYEKLIYEGKQISLASLDTSMKDSILTIFSASQSFSMMGWRLGYAAGTNEIINAMESIQSSITAATSYISQTALTAVLNSNENYVKNLVSEFKKRRDTLYPKLNKISWLDCELPASGPYFWCNIENLTIDSLNFSNKLLEKEKIAVMPGDPFGAPGWIRIAFNAQPISILEDVVRRIERFGENYEEEKNK